MRSPSLVGLVCLFFCLPAGAQLENAEVKIIRPVVDKSGEAVFQAADDGKRYPVVHEAEESALVRKVQAVLASGVPQETLRLDRFARNLLTHQQITSHSHPGLDLTSPMYLLLSTEEGGFARYGFWLESQTGKRELLMVHYVDLVVDDSSIEDGSFEEIFPHELAHVTLRSLFGERFEGPSVKMHQSMSVTDYLTAFDEGYAEHFQPIVRDSTHNPALRALGQAMTPVDLDLFWLSRMDGQLRTAGVKQNRFVHRKSIPLSAYDKADPYLVFTDSETSPDFLHDELKSGQEMMASEGVISTLFYRIVNDDSLRNTYRDAAFYSDFFSQRSPADIRSAITPYENVNLKLFAAMRAVAQSGSAHDPLLLAIVRQYATMFPDEADSIYHVLLSTTYGATVSHEAANAFEKALQAGRRGDIENFRADSRAAFAALSKIKSEVVKGSTPVDADIGPELWLLNSEFKIAPAYWQEERTQPLTLNLNTAAEAELMTIRGIDLPLAQKIVAERRQRGYFKSIDELRQIDGISPELLQRLDSMAVAVRSASHAARP